MTEKMSKRGDTKLADCDCCTYENVTVNFISDETAGNAYQGYWVCDVCYKTFISSLWSQWGGDATVLLVARSIAYIGNMILDEVRKGKKE